MYQNNVKKPKMSEFSKAQNMMIPKADELYNGKGLQVIGEAGRLEGFVEEL